MELEKLINFEDINKICRYCLDYQPELKSIFNNEIVAMTTKLLHINDMIESDGLPKFICIKCYDKLMESYRFQSQCLLSLELLNDLLISRKEMVQTSTTNVRINRDTSNKDSNISTESEYNVLEKSDDSKNSNAIDLNDIPIKTNAKIQENGITNKKEPELSICPICGVRVKENSLKGHIYRHLNKKSYECDFCGRLLNYKHALRAHFFIHMNVRRFKCTICDKAYVDKTSLRVHMLNHTNEKNFICNICGRAFSQSCGLGVHMKRHAQKLDYKCSLCDLRFINRYTVKKHEATHNTEYSFKCDLCPKAFTCHSYLKQHYRITHIQYPIKCDQCDQELHNLSTYNKHKKQHEYKII